MTAALGTAATAADLYAEDLAQAIDRAGKSKTSFYLAMRMLPAARRNAMFAIYAFCRDVDDIADEPAPDAVKQRELDAWRRDIGLLYDGAIPARPLARALIQPIAAYDLQRRDFDAVIDGMQTDAETQIVAPSLAALDLYCAQVASAVGRLSVRTFGPWSPDADRVADHLGRALQLTNILRDLDEDGARGRLYLPAEMLAAHGVPSNDVATALADPRLDVVCRDVARLAHEHFTQANAAMALCEATTMRPARMMRDAYRAILQRLERQGWASPRTRVSLSAGQKLWLATRAFLAL